MKKNVSTALLICLTGILGLSLMLSGCSKKEKTAESAKQEEQSAAITTVGPADGTKLQMWTFVELHSQFYASMLEEWNSQHPDKPITITFTTYPYADMHNKLTMANQTGQGAPDLCDGAPL